MGTCEGMNSDLEGFDDKEEAGELDALPCEPAIFFVDELDKRIQLQTINIGEDRENIRASGRDPAMLVGIVWFGAVRTVIRKCHHSDSLLDLQGFCLRKHR